MLRGPAGSRTVDETSLQCRLTLRLPFGYRARLELVSRRNGSVVVLISDGDSVYNRTVRGSTSLVTVTNHVSLALTSDDQSRAVSTPEPGRGPGLETELEPELERRLEPRQESEELEHQPAPASERRLQRQPAHGSESVLEVRWSAEPADNSTADCGWPWLGHDSWCYHMPQEAAEWRQAAAACAALDSSLVTVSDASTEGLLAAVMTDR